MKQKVLVTGASGAFGSRICKTLIEKGFEVVGTMRSTSGKNENVFQELKSIGVGIVELDVTNEESVTKGVEKAIHSMNGLDILVNNAGVGSYGLQELFTADQMQKIFDVNVFGVQRVMRAALPHFRTQGKGTVLSISSLIGRVTSPFYGTYSASKWALEAIIENYRSELSGFGIETCLVEPGPMPTEFLDIMLMPKESERMESYGEMAAVPKISLEGLQQAIKSNPEQRPQKVAENVVRLLTLPFGEKPFRTTVDFMGLGEPINQYNDVLHKITRDIYTNFGTEGMLALNKK